MIRLLPMPCADLSKRIGWSAFTFSVPWPAATLAPIALPDRRRSRLAYEALRGTGTAAEPATLEETTTAEIFAHFRLDAELKAMLGAKSPVQSTNR